MKSPPTNAGAGKLGAKPAAGNKLASTGKPLTMNPINFKSVKPLLTRHTCLVCHNADIRQVGPAYREVAKRGYTDE